MKDRIIGALRTVDGRGVVDIADRFDTDVDDLWAAITQPERLARWWGRVQGDLRVGGRFEISTVWEGGGTVEACEPPHRLLVSVRESDESYRKGDGVPPFDETIEATLIPDGEGTILRIEVCGMPVDKTPFYGVGWQINVERLAALLAGSDPGDPMGENEARWDALLPAYLAMDLNP